MSDKINAAQYEHAKHLFLMRKNQESLKNFEEITQLAKSLGEEVSPIYLLRIESAKAHSTHSKLMSDFWLNVLEANHRKAIICINCMKANSLRVEESMSELVKLGRYTEQEYIEHMNRFRDEFRCWDNILEGDEHGFLMAREDLLTEMKEVGEWFGD